MDATTLNLCFAAYLAALACYAAAHVSDRPRARQAGHILLAAAWLLQTVFLAQRWRVSGHAPMSNQFESLVSMAWGITALAGCLWRLAPGRWLGPATAGLNLVLLALCALLDKSVAPLVPALQSNWLLLHVSVIMLAYSALALSFLASAAYLLSHHRRPAEQTAALDLFNERAMGLGYLLLTAGIILGAVWANEAWGTYWSWDPKETWSLITWLVYTGAIHLRRTHRWHGRAMAWFSAAGFAVVLFTYFGVNYLMSSLHSYAGSR
ncbi:MAG: c-type cytochrome biogenesis protein CcsB [Elusimicrobia bacterium]|nr:c-type cytochrome biogenesis protein CcsB [Elusimicrobiota bacterium]